MWLNWSQDGLGIMKYRYALGRRKYETNATITAIVLLLPTFIALVILFIYPVSCDQDIYTEFHEY